MKLTADRLPIDFVSQWEAVPFLERLSSNKPTDSTCRIAMFVSGQPLDFEPIREHEPPHGGANKKRIIGHFLHIAMG